VLQISTGKYVIFKSGDKVKKGIIRKIYEFNDYPEDIKKQYRIANPKDLKVYKLKVETESGEKEYIWDFMVFEICDDETLPKEDEWQRLKNLKKQRKKEGEEKVKRSDVDLFT
jgi:hypothetical protein